MTNKNNITRKQFTAGMLLMLLGMGSLLSFFILVPSIIHAGVGCNGIDEYYTGTEFMPDVMSVLVVNSTMTWKWPVQPADFKKVDGITCKDYSNAIMCLCELYNETCRFYSYVINDEEMLLHMGIKWLDNGNWRYLY